MDTRGSYIYHTLLQDQIRVMMNSLMGELQKHLYNGEYVLLKRAPVFESDFIQITKKGQVVNIHHQVTIVTIGLTSTNPDLQLPDVMLLARPSEQQKKTWKLRSHHSCSLSSDVIGPASARYSWSTTPSSAHSWGAESAPSQLSPPDTGFMEPSFTTKRHLELTGLLPLKLVKISIFHKQKRRLRVNLASGRIFYLQLYVHPDCEQKVFGQWVKLVHLLQQAGGSRFSPAKVLPDPRENISHSGSSLIQQQRHLNHCGISERFQRDKESRERELWKCETWKKDPEESEIRSVLAERSLWGGSGGSQQDKECLISRQASLAHLPVRITCRYSPTDNRPAFTTHIHSRVFYVEEREKSSQGCTSLGCISTTHQGEGRGRPSPCCSESRPAQAQTRQPVPREPQKCVKKERENQLVKRREKPRKEKERKHSKEEEKQPAEREEDPKEEVKVERMGLKGPADLVPKGSMSVEQRKAEIILWMKKAEEEEKKHQEEKKTKKEKVTAQH